MTRDLQSTNVVKFFPLIYLSIYNGDETFSPKSKQFYLIYLWLFLSFSALPILRISSNFLSLSAHSAVWTQWFHNTDFATAIAFFLDCFTIFLVNFFRCQSTLTELLRPFTLSCYHTNWFSFHFLRFYWFSTVWHLSSKAFWLQFLTPLPAFRYFQCIAALVDFVHIGKKYQFPLRIQNMVPNHFICSITAVKVPFSLVSWSKTWSILSFVSFSRW